MINNAQANAKEVKLTGKIIRANGEVVDLGTIAEVKKKTSLLEKIMKFFSNK